MFELEEGGEEEKTRDSPWSVEERHHEKQDSPEDDLDPMYLRGIVEESLWESPEYPTYE
jgi:hypothetical protein